MVNRENIERFFYWINERHNIYVKRRASTPAPWTEDEILRKYKFTNPFRENGYGVDAQKLDNAQRERALWVTDFQHLLVPYVWHTRIR